MRTYFTDSPEAAARIVALVLVADGHVCRSEIDALNHLNIERELGLPAGGFAQQIQTLCEDLLAGAGASGSIVSGVDELTLAAFMAEVQQPELQRTVMKLARAAANADLHLADGEFVVLNAARQHWGFMA
ncbi:MAG: TerB family tellurite resistance protein [Rubrivivax sp.]|nr:MAG: TerB family tellurite resistance protein [Rubrivivax sp.]